MAEFDTDVIAVDERVIATETDIDLCQFHHWYPLLHPHVIKGEVIYLDQEFVQYLNEDGIMLPGSGKQTNYDSDGDSIDGKVLRVHNEVPAFNQLTSLQEQVKAILEKYEGEVFVKLNWSAPIDALWVNGESAKCLNVDDVFLLLKASDRVLFDIEKMYELCDESAKKTPEQLYLVVKKWANLNPAMEFRLFVHQNKLVGICQRDCCTYYKFLHEQWEELEGTLEDFYEERVAGKLALSSYTMDVYVDRKKRVWVVDVNPFGEPSCALLFEWSELRTLSDLDFRFVKSHEERLSSTKGASRGPADVHMSSDISRFMDICKQQMAESDSEEESR